MSICKSCHLSRHCVSNELHNDNYVGCALLLQDSTDFKDDTDLEPIKGEVYKGWIRRSGYNSKEKSGQWINEQLITRNVISCPWFTPQ